MGMNKNMFYQQEKCLKDNKILEIVLHKKCLKRKEKKEMYRIN